LDIRKNLKAAYGVRSTYVHGAVPSKRGSPTHEELVQIFRSTADYARLACLIIVQMTKINGKNNLVLLKALDDAMIDDIVRDQLDDWCGAVALGRQKHG
jgi:hypothetical protein